jgi:Family of unknown function (DUF5995)
VSVDDGATDPTTVVDFDGTIAALEAIVARSRADDDRGGYFPAMYLAVTRTVRERSAGGLFADGPAMERFVAAFARRYLDAYGAFQKGEPCPRSWHIALSSARSWRPIILQHLLLGINAHINLDLGVTAADVGGAGPLHAVRADFDAVNDVLGSLVDGCQRALDQVSPWLDLADRIGGRHDEALVRFSLAAARRQAWSVAERLHPLHGAERRAAIDVVDTEAAGIARRVRHPGVAASALLLAVRLRERAAPSRVIALLAAVRPAS